LVAFQLDGEHSYDEFDVAGQLAAERGWMVPAYTMPPNAQHVKMMRVLVKQTMGRSLTTALSQDIAEACAALEERGRLHPTVRKRVHSNTGF
jgi:glutamate decarboxylase